MNSNVDFQFKKIDIATGNMDKMLSFYTEAFGIRFEEIVESIRDEEWKLYLGNLGGIKFFLCPNEPSGTTKNQAGVHQFHLRVSNIDQFVSDLKDKGYDIDEIPFGEGEKNFYLRDPDGHPWIISS